MERYLYLIKRPDMVGLFIISAPKRLRHKIKDNLDHILRPCFKNIKTDTFEAITQLLLLSKMKFPSMFSGLKLLSRFLQIIFVYKTA